LLATSSLRVNRPQTLQASDSPAATLDQGPSA
jgi:hypothetical protein